MAWLIQCDLHKLLNRLVSAEAQKVFKTSMPAPLQPLKTHMKNKRSLDCLAEHLQIEFWRSPWFVIELLWFFSQWRAWKVRNVRNRMQIVLHSEPKWQPWSEACKFICLGSFKKKKKNESNQWGRWCRDENNLHNKQQSSIIWKMVSLNNAAADWGLSPSALRFQIQFAPTLIFLVIPTGDFSRKRSICLFQSP